MAEPNRKQKPKQKSSMKPISHTLSAQAAIRRPAYVIDCSRKYGQMIWLPEQAELFSNALVQAIEQEKKTVWACVCGPFGFGKTAISNALTWRFHEARLIALPPISATGFSEVGKAIAALLQHLEAEKGEEIVACWKVFEQKIRKGKSDPVHGLIDFLIELAGPKGILGRPLVIQLDELQQLLGSLDADSLITFREFVWGLRTEALDLGIVLSMDAFLEARLERWAADILHRIREQGHRLALQQLYDRQFPAWLWQCWKDHGVIDADLSLSPALMASLGQYVERWDLAYGPRTVVEVFQRAVDIGTDVYDVEMFVRDICLGKLRFLSQESEAAKAILRALSDGWVRQDAQRQRLVRVLAAFPNGCPQDLMTQFFPDRQQSQTLIDQAFGPLLVRGKEGIALECLQPVQRGETFLDEVIQKTWHLMPSYEALAARAPELFGKRLLELIFLDQKDKEGWRLEATPWPQWYILQGDVAGFRNRRIAICFGDGETDFCPEDVELILYFQVTLQTEQTDTGCYRMDLAADRPAIRFNLPILQPIPHGLPMGLDRYRKFLEPEPLTALHLLVLLQELDAIKDRNEALAETVRIRLGAIATALAEVVVKILIHGKLAAPDSGISASLRGKDLVRALITFGLRQMYPDYIPLPSSESLEAYLKALARGVERIEGSKQVVFQQAFGLTSTAGQSYIRTLGPLVKASGSPSQFALQLTLHPAEQVILAMLADRGDRCLVLEAVDVLLCQGWSQEEAQTAIQLLAARKIISEDKGLLTRQQEFPKPNDTTQEDREDKRQIWIETLQRQVGKLRSLQVADAARFVGPVGTHLGGVAEKIAGQRDQLITTCRKHLDVLASESISEKKINREIDRIDQAIRDLTTNHQHLVMWHGIDMELARLVQELQAVNLPTLQATIDRLIGKLREQFATDAWNALQAAEAVQSQVEGYVRDFQNHRYDRIRLFWQMRKQWRMALEGAIDDRTQASLPDLDAFDADPIQAWEALQTWVIESCRSVLHKLPETLSGKHQWQDPSGSKSKYRDIRKTAMTALEKAVAHPSHEHLSRLAEQVGRLCRGFPDDVVLSDPSLPMYFERIRQLLQSGRGTFKLERVDA